jgi:DNA polymerase (family 10)
VECDILPDGRLDFDDAVLAQLDYVVVSIHNAFTQDEAAMTARLIRAIENPYATMVGHLTGRLLLRREGYRVDVGQIMKSAAARNVVIELNANPQRLDMDWRHWRRAASAGAAGQALPLCSINPDAHDADGLAFVRAGINSARKGWLTKENVLNCRSLADVKKWLEGRERRAARP